jgi:tagatose-1,6-bisphosphate aldolase
MTVKRRSENSSSISSITTRDDDLLFTTDRSNMDYVTFSGVCKQTGAEESDLAVFILGQLKHNALDSTESYASATLVPSSYGVTTITNNNVDCKHHCLH